MIFLKILILVLILISLIPYVRKAPAKAVKELGIWVILFLLCIVFYYSQTPLVAHFEEAPPAHANGEVTEGGNIVYERSRDGHFYIDVTIDGNIIHFMIDTGASDVVLTAEDAKKIGYNINELSFSQSYQTANGVVKGAPIIIRNMAIAENTLVIHDVEGSINTSLEDVSLLGMSFLEKVKGYQVTRNYLTLFLDDNSTK